MCTVQVDRAHSFLHIVLLGGSPGGSVGNLEVLLY